MQKGGNKTIIIPKHQFGWAQVPEEDGEMRPPLLLHEKHTGQGMTCNKYLWGLTPLNSRQFYAYIAELGVAVKSKDPDMGSID